MPVFHLEELKNLHEVDLVDQTDFLQVVATLGDHSLDTVESSIFKLGRDVSRLIL